MVITDDLDGSPGGETVSFGLDGVSYEIDLGQPNQARLAGAFAAFIAAGRRVSRGSRRRAADSRAGRGQIAAPCGPGPGRMRTVRGGAERALQRNQ